jgi:hypothetical protein
MHLESITRDVTHQTNKEKHDLLVGSCKDGSFKGFPFVCAFIPSQKQWVFHVLFSKCIGGVDVTVKKIPQQS